MPLNALVVDDSPVMRKVVIRVLNLSGFEIGAVHEAANGEEALAFLLDGTDVDFILTDVNMPVMNGIDFLSAVKTAEELKHIPVIIISTEGRSQIIEEILKIGASGYITKPFKPEDIRHVLSDALGVDIDGSFIKEPEDSDF